jgi:hypothetical protein
MPTNPKPAVSVAPGVKIKGTAFLSVMRALEQLRGKHVAEAALAAMPEELRNGLRYGRMVAGGWYPIEQYRDLFSTVVSTTNEGERIVRDIGREAARLDMTGIYKAVFKLLSPQIIFDLSARLFSNYYNTGKVTIIESRHGFVHACWTGCKGFNRHLWVEVFSSVEMYLELAGAKNVRMRTLSGAGENDEFAEAQARWT